MISGYNTKFLGIILRHVFFFSVGMLLICKLYPLQRSKIQKKVYTGYDTKLDLVGKLQF